MNRRRYSNSITRMNLISLFRDAIKIVYYLFKWIFVSNQEEILEIWKKIYLLYFYIFLTTSIKFYYAFNKMLNTSIMISYRLMIKRPWVYTKKEERQ